MGSDALTIAAPAKLNLFLEVLGRRADGYHEIDSVFTEIDLADTVRLEKCDRIELTAEGLSVPCDATNLAWRAAAALGVGAKIHLIKRIPPGAGLGGGSSDAAAVLRGLVTLYGLDWPADRLAEAAVTLGADVPYFLVGGTARCRGIGELVESIQAPRRRTFVLLCPSVSISTTKVYGSLPSVLTGDRETATVFLRRYLEEVGPNSPPFHNGLQAPAERLDPRLSALRVAAEAAFDTRFTMTGSGAAYFAEIGPWLRRGVRFHGITGLAATQIEVRTR
ncbi:MAG: 4-(cytidine 5'-diphospho)-2-C-methyl-D-erythritol kinase [Planctomycetota bacterium]|nr:4-(cytidine 5'-diphospho)-2-C-methyl-D-erythritol kinase [Planctomycetota bacterium]